MRHGFSHEDPLFGGALTESPTRKKHKPGVIVRVNPKQGSCDVASEGCYYANVPMPGLDPDPEGSGGDYAVKKRGLPVMLRMDAGWPVISQVLPISTDPSALARPRFRVDPTSSSSDELFDSADGPTFLGRMPRDAHMGDRVWMGNQGQHLALLEGGIATLSASPMSLVEVNQEGDTTLVAGRNTRILSGFGRMEFRDSEGKSSFLFEGGTDQLTQSGAGKENWTSHLEIGGNSEGVLDFRTQNLAGDRMTAFSIDMDGSASHYNAGNVTHSVDGIQENYVGQGRATLIQQGNDEYELSNGTRNERIYGNLTRECFDTLFCRVGSNRRDNVSSDWSIATGRNMKFNVSGDALFSNPTTNALDFTVTNGSVLFDVGNVVAGDTGKSISGFKVNTHGLGNVELLAKELGMAMMDAALPAASVYVGASLPYNPKFEPAVLGWKFITLIQTIVKTYDTHVHMLPPPVAALAAFAPTLTPILPMTPLVDPALPVSVSKKVMVGL